MDLEELLCWVALSAVGRKGRDRADILAGGGARAVLTRSGHTDTGIRHAMRVKPFLESGGMVLGGRDALGRAEAHGPPLVLYGRGGLTLEDPAPAVAVIGARDPTPRGEARARHVAEELARAGAVVVSGAARGIDRAAHEAAVGAGGKSIAVLGEPVRASGDDERPHFLRALFDGARDRTLSVTPFGPWTNATRRLFASRNEWIAALSDAVIVIEGSPTSGTRHTLRAARRQGRRLLALPGDIDDPLAATPNDVLRGLGDAYLPGGVGLQDLLGAPAALEAAPSELPLPLPEAQASPILRTLAEHGGILDVDSLAARLGVPVHVLLADVAELQLEGLLAQDGPLLRATARQTA
jgi:DNA processing protein